MSPQHICSQETAANTAVQEFLENMGGEELWKSTNFIYLKEKMWNKQANVIDMEVWLDLTSPKSKIKLKNETFDRVRAFTEHGGWGKLENGRQYEFDSLRLKQEIANWKRNIYAICRRIALDKEELTFDLKPNNILEIYEDTGTLLCIVELNVNSIPIKWVMKSSYGEEVTLHGPLDTFGRYRLPGWSTSQDGHWQFEYVEVKGYKTAPNISFEPEDH
ncbi:hypothetical protein SAMN04488116_3511 [Flagellimonas flava]|uniref:Uncharacterized protein n=2 Tax=Flagellimonas flava TaxID=570519 RepID=A0A1M5Q5J7_9FLAO|nr:hypothetical protein SAMN04488116_3511 [Allomuricauda flava]